MPAVDFNSLLSIPTDQAPRPKAFPECWLKAVCTGNSFDSVPWDKETTGARFTYKPTELATDPESGEDFGLTEDDLPENYENRTVSHIFPIVAERMYQLTNHLDAVLGAESGRSFRERIPETRGASVIIHVTQRPNPKGGEPYNDVREVFAA